MKNNNILDKVTFWDEKKDNQWQFDPDSIETEKVQYWVNGVMITAQLTKAEAQQKVKERKAFVISDQAIGDFRDGKKNS